MYYCAMSNTRQKGRLINLSMANHAFQVLTENDKGEKSFFRTIKLGPYNATKEEFDYTDPRIAGMLRRPVVGREEVRENPALRQRKFLFTEPDAGTELSTIQAMGDTYKTCKFAGSVEDGTKQMHPYPLVHSVYQAQLHLLSLSDIARIERYLTIDERPLVQAYGRDLLHYRRTNLKRAEEGLEPLRGKAAITNSLDNGFKLDVKF